MWKGICAECGKKYFVFLGNKIDVKWGMCDIVEIDV